MTQEEINDYNRRCAEFLGMQPGYFKSEIDCSNPKYQWMCTYANCTYEIQKEDFPLLNVWDYLNFHSDWNWIHEMVEAIEKLNIHVSIIDEECCIIDKEKAEKEENPFMIKPISFVEAKTKKEAVVQAINEFLIWYNNESKN